jgi:hypothetical protein
MSKDNPFGYTEEDLVSLQECKPRFDCPRCKESNWASTTLFHSTPTRLWKAESSCLKCKKPVRWLIDPDLTVEYQTKEMHRPIGFI